MSQSDLLAAADHIRDANEADRVAASKAPMRRALAINAVDGLLELIGKDVHEARLGTETTSEFADELEHIATMLEAVYTESSKLRTRIN